MTLNTLLIVFAKCMVSGMSMSILGLYQGPILLFIYLVGIIGMGVIGGLKAIYEKDK